MHWSLIGLIQCISGPLVQNCIARSAFNWNILFFFPIIIFECAVRFGAVSTCSTLLVVNIPSDGNRLNTHSVMVFPIFYPNFFFVDSFSIFFLFRVCQCVCVMIIKNTQNIVASSFIFCLFSSSPTIDS